MCSHPKIPKKGVLNFNWTYKIFLKHFNAGYSDPYRSHWGKIFFIYKGKKKIVLHQIPSGILTDNCQCVLGNGMVIDPVDLVEELGMLKENGVHYNGFIHIASNAHIVTPVHKWIDVRSEENSGQKIGTTCRGIGPAYVDKYNRCGIQGLDLNDLKNLKQKVMDRLDLAISSGELSEPDRADIMEEIEEFLERSSVIAPMVEDTFSMLHEMVENKQNILLEGAQGTMLDVNHGTYPFVIHSALFVYNVMSNHVPWTAKKNPPRDLL